MRKYKLTSKIDVPVVSDKVKECIPIRKHISQVLRKDMNEQIKRIIKLSSCSKERIPDFKYGFIDLVRKAVHYRGGWPTENSRGVIQSKAEDLAKLVVFLKAAGYESLINEELEKAGITKIEVSNIVLSNMLAECPTFFENNKKIHDCFEKIDAIQTEICQMADSIKIDAFNELPSDILKTKDNPTGLSATDFSELVIKKAGEKPKDGIIENISIIKNNRDNYGVYVNGILK